MAYEMTAKEYETLYARYLERKPEELLTIAGLKKGDAVLDLCAGSGRASLAALKMGARIIVAVDENNNGFSKELLQERAKGRVVTFGRHTIERFLFANEVSFKNKQDSYYEAFDVAVCQQAINYWLTDEDTKYLADHLKPGGRFVFNTFHNKPSEKPTIKNYSYKGKDYVEGSYCFNNVVHHVQLCDGMRPHVTEFKWIAPKDFMKILKPHFELVKVHRDGGTDIYACTK